MTRRSVVGVALVALAATEARAQATGLPIRSGTIPTGITVGMDIGFGRAKDTNAGSTAIGAVATAGLGPFGGRLGIARSDVESGGVGTAVFAAADLTVFGGPLVPLKLVWQAGYARWFDRPAVIASDPTRSNAWRGWVGAGASLTIPAAVLSIKPWLAPRLEYFGKQPVQGVRVKPGLSGGVDLGLLNGLGLRASYDSRLGWTDGRDHATGVSFGLSYHF